MNKNQPSETKQILADTLEELLETKPFQKITVNELCEKCSIVRSTFYLHFQDKYDLLKYCLDENAKKLDVLMETQAPKDFFIVMLSNCQEKEKIFYHLFETEINEELVDMFYQFFSRYITQYLEEKAAEGALLPGPVDAVTSFYVGGLVGMTLRWIKTNYKLPKEALAACQCRLMKDFL